MNPPVVPAQMLPSRLQTTERVGFMGSTGSRCIWLPGKLTSVRPVGDENQRLPCWSIMRLSMLEKRWS